MAGILNLDLKLGLNMNAPIIGTYRDYCASAKYPRPFDKQVDMYKFAFENPERTPREILAARKLGKTDYITICGSGYSILKNPNYKILLITKEATRGKEIVAEVRETLANNGAQFTTRSKTRVRVRGCRGKEANLTALTIRSKGIRGRHPDIVIMEDPITPEDTSETERARVKKTYEEILKLTQNVAIIGQPVHADDLYQELRGKIQTMEVWHGTIPELDVDLEVERAAGVSEASIQASYFGKILDDGGQPFRRVELVDYHAPKNVMFIDPSHKGGDLTAIAIGGFLGDTLPVVGFAFRKAWYDCLDELDKILGWYNVGRICIETNGLGDLPVMQLRGEGLAGVCGKNHTGNKHRRIMNMASFADALKLYDATNNPNLPPEFIQANQLFIERVRKYEYNVKQDDPPDAMAGLCGFIGIIKDD